MPVVSEIPFMTTYHIRRAAKKDVSAIRSLEGEIKRVRASLFSAATTSFHKKIAPAKKISKDIPSVIAKNDIVFVVETKEGAVVGMVRGSIQRRAGYLLSRMGHVERLIVLDKHRRHGLAKKLCQRLMREFKERGCDHVVVHTDAENTIARAFYASLGVREATIQLFKKL